MVIRVKILEPLRGTHFAVGLDGLHDPLADHRNTAIIPASRVRSPKPELTSLPGAATTRREPGNCAVMRTGSGRLAELAQMRRTHCGEIETARRNPSFKNLFRLARVLDVSLCQMSETVASAPSGPVYERTVYLPRSHRSGCWPELLNTPPSMELSNATTWGPNFRVSDPPGVPESSS